MKRLSLFSIVLLAFLRLSAGQLVLIKTTSQQHQAQLLENPVFKVHYVGDDFVVATTDFVPKEEHVLLDPTAWENGKRYYMLRLPDTGLQTVLADLQSKAEVLYSRDQLVVVRVMSPDVPIAPYRHNGVARLFPEPISLPEQQQHHVKRNLTPDPFVQQLINQVNPLNITSTTQHLEDYGTRNAYHSQSVNAQNWIVNKFQSYGLSVEVMDFTMPGGAASDNVIATLTGTKYPNEYVVVGAHYDSYSNSSSAPGADDNASGTAGVLEIARIMSNYNFDRSIIFCAFSGEEYGLYGSAAYALRAKNQGMNILGYINMDMIGYLKPGNTVIKSSLIYPPTAAPLAQFYTEVCATYLPDFLVTPGSLSGGDSDHTSFNNNGFMGIFPFEAIPDYSPFIHTANDRVGPSYNNPAQAAIFTRAALATIAVMANKLNPPQNLVAIAGSNYVKLNWSPLPDAAYFKIYRNGQVIDSTANNKYFDLDLVNGISYTYRVTAVYQQTLQESSPSNAVNVTPMPPMLLPVTMDFESGAGYWQFTHQWGISTVQAYSPTHSLSDSPNGNYANNTTSYAYLRPIDLSLGYTSAALSFWTRYDLETNYDYVYLEVSTNGTSWTQLGQFNGVQNTWQQRNFNLNPYLGQSWVQIRFKFSSDGSVVKDGIYIDDFQVITTGGYQVQYSLLRPGWNALGSSVVPVQQNISEIFADLGSDLLAVQSAVGLYYPSAGINTLINWDATQGYKVRMDAPAVLVLAGPLEAPASFGLQAGWNLIPQTADCPISPTALMVQGMIIKEVAGTGVYWPDAGVNNLASLLPGKSYYLYSPQPTQLTYPSCKSNSNLQSRPIPNADPLPARTGDSHLFLLAADVLQQIFEPNDVLLAFTPEGIIAGAANIQSTTQPLVLTVFGFDSISPVIQGFKPGEEVVFKRLRGTSLQNLLAVYDLGFPQTSGYAHQGLSKIMALGLPTVLQESAQIVKVYPNPTSGILYMVGHEEDTPYCVFDVSGKKVATGYTSPTKPINLSTITRGTYLLQIGQGQMGKLYKVIIAD